MDIFIDKFAQRKNAQELIKANSMAEAEENERLNAQVAVCEETLQEVHKVSLQNLANAEKTGQVLDAAMKKILEVQNTAPDADQKVLDEIAEVKATLAETAEMKKEISEVKVTLAELKEEVSKISEMKKILETGMQEQDSKLTEALDGWNRQIEAMFKNAEDFNHKEAVKVYRNVQAVLEEQLAKQSQETTEKVSQLMEQKKSGKGILPVCILTFAAVLVNITIVVLQLLGIF